MDDGFTLIEMLLSVFIVAIIATFVIINLTEEVGNTNLTTASLKVQSVIEMTRSCALTTAETANIVLDAHHVQSSCIDSELDLGELNITSNFPSQTLSFNSNGNIIRGGTIEICNENECQKIVIGIGASDVKIE